MADKKSILVLLACMAGAIHATAAPLPMLGADPAQTSVSGFSSGGYMAVQLQVAYSGSIIGAGVMAAGPYYCAANNKLFLKICMGQVPSAPPNPKLMVAAAKRFAGMGLIDPVDNLAARRIFVFAGTRDSIVGKPAVDAAAAFFEQIGVKRGNLNYVSTVPAGHAILAPGSGNECAANAAPFISQCLVEGKAYDQAGSLLQHIYGRLESRADTPAGQVISFDQRSHAARGAGLADSGFLYVPASCAAGNARCRVHVALHGCMQSAEAAGNRFITETGYNNWADNNRLLILYPQVKRSSEAPDNPNGCWDWWGYTDEKYAYKSGLQMKAVKSMIDRLVQPR